MLVTLSGIVISFNELHPEKAAEPISLISAQIITVLSIVLLANALLPIYDTGKELIYGGMTTTVLYLSFTPVIVASPLETE